MQQHEMLSSPAHPPFFPLCSSQQGNVIVCGRKSQYSL